MDMLWNWVYSMNSTCSDPYCAAVTQIALSHYSGHLAGVAVTLMRCTLGVLQCYMYRLGPIPLVRGECCHTLTKQFKCNMALESLPDTECTLGAFYFFQCNATGF